jgi:Mn2+/Fe2+ NRAMP family transporter
MKRFLGITLGIMTALGGFVDLGQIVFTTQAGALFGYRLLWAIAIGTIAIIVYMEMCGRVAVVAHEPVFSVVRDCLGKRLGLATLLASNLLNLITCGAELAGVAIVLHLLVGWPERIVLIGSTLFLAGLVLLCRFQWIERIFGLSGLLMIAFAVAALTLHPDWHHVARGLLPTMRPSASGEGPLYAYFAVGIFSAMLMEYEVHFYSSGAIEEDWKPKDLGENFMVALLGSVLGSLLTVALLMLGALIFFPRHIFPNLLSTAVWTGAYPFAQKALIVSLLGALACIAGAAVETALSTAYNVCQFFNWHWGKDLPFRSAPVFHATWLGTLVFGLAVALIGIRPLDLINYSIIFGMVIMPLTYYPILRVAADKNVMGSHVNSRSLSMIGMLFLVLITAAAVAAIPLMIVTHSGRP